ncbi:TIGR00730 family Rossman fold protein [Corynebacterium sp. 335C]
MSDTERDPSSGAAPIVVAACVVRRADGRVLAVRKRGTGRFMLPGGKPEPGERPLATVLREVREELGLELAPGDVAEWGTVSDAAANEPGRRVTGHHFLLKKMLDDGTAAAIRPHAELEELRWVDPWAPTGRLAPMLENRTLARLRREDRERAAAGNPSPAASPAASPARVLPGHEPRAIRSVTVFAGSVEGADPAWRECAEALGRELARERVTLVYGGASTGLMGASADAALAAGGEVVGVMPGLLVDKEMAHPGLTRFERVDTMPQRKDRMYALGDAFVALPGGGGTLEEFFEVWTRQHIGIHQQPVALVGPAGFWDPLTALLRRLSDDGFIQARHVDSLVVVEDPADLLPALAAWRPPGSKWAP